MDFNDINNFRQNHPALIVRDLAAYVDANLATNILKFRGVNKWLRVRRLLIQLKSKWKQDIKDLQIQKQKAKGGRDWVAYYKLVGYVEALIDCRQQVRALCHSPRDIDFPESPRDFGLLCVLPDDFPRRPHKRWFWRYQGIK
jgi:hypothetical protein